MYELIIIGLVIFVVLFFLNMVKLAKSIDEIDKLLEAVAQRVVDNDPQFDEERELRKAMDAGESGAGRSLFDLAEWKEADGKPSLLKPF